jgi:electron transport complex protein RnfC
MAFLTFRGGVHPPDYKELTENKKIEVLEAPKMLYIPLLQHIGSVLEPLVSVGDRVLKGQKIADSSAFLSVPVHSSVSGVVKKIEVLPFTLRGKVNTIVIENDGQYEWAEVTKYSDHKALEASKLLEIIRENGIVGLGGAGFPTHVKLNPPKDKTVETLLINSAECEPYLNTDNRLMIEEPAGVIKGIEIVMHILKVDKAVIGIENNKPEAIKAMKDACNGRKDITVAELETKYPQGGEKQLIKAILNKEVPSGKLPLEIGVVVQNTTTLYAIYNAVYNGHPLIEETITVSGKAIENPGNIKTPIGTLIEDVLNHTGIDRDKTKKLVAGGPMMGTGQYTEKVPVMKGASGILALTKEEVNATRTRACISCGKCVDACPMNLSPLMYAKLARFENWEELEQYSIFDCMECGTCQYVCPANRPLIEAIKLGKAKLRSMK